MKPDSMKVSFSLIRTHNFSARVIHFGMLLWALLRGLKPTKSLNHAEVRFGDSASGALAHGVETRNWLEYVKTKKYIEWYDFRLELTPAQWYLGSEYLCNIENTKYELENFWHHTLKIFTGRWHGSSRANEIYCYEHVIRFLNATCKYKLDTNMNPYEFTKWANENIPSHMITHGVSVK